MSIPKSLPKSLLGALGLSLVAASLHLPANAQTAPISETQIAVSSEAEQLTTTPVSLETAEGLTTKTDSLELAQARRRTRNTARGSNFIGIGADFGTADDVTFAVISKYALNNQVALRPSVLVGDDFAVLVPVTYEFNQFSTNVQGFQIRPYAGLGASYTDANDESNLGLLATAGLDIPVSRRFTLNTQANYAGIFSDEENFGVTVGIGYNFSDGRR